MKKEIIIDRLFQKVYCVLKETKTPYILIGGLAAGVMGQPRFTQDADFLVFMSRNELDQFLKTAVRKGLQFNKEEVDKTVIEKGIFRLFLGDYHADFVINALKFGKSALKRTIRIKLFNQQVVFPSPEDLILIKLIAGRELDLIDAKNIYIRHKGKLDQNYLVEWAQKICNETENMKVWNSLQKLIKKHPS